MNQVCKIDKSGMVGFEGESGNYVRWIYDKFVDPKHMLRSGQPTQLRSPTDAIMWQEMEPMGASQNDGTSVVHCVIADSGNSRIVDLVYRVKGGLFVKYDGTAIDNSYIDAESQFVLPELNWVSKTDSLNERYAFDCLQLVTTPDGSPVNKISQDIWVASSNYASNGVTQGSPIGGAGLGGAILALNYRQRSMKAGAGPGEWDYSSTASGTITATCDHVNLNGKVVPLANPRYFDVIDGQLGRSMLVCDNYGVYEVRLLNNGSVPVSVKALLEADYRDCPRSFEKDPAALADDPAPKPMALGIPLQATSVQRLSEQRWLIANSYAGSSASGATKFNGEVFTFDFDPAIKGVTWCSPRLQWVNSKDGWQQTTTNTYDLRQPKSASRKQ